MPESETDTDTRSDRGAAAELRSAQGDARDAANVARHARDIAHVVEANRDALADGREHIADDREASADAREVDADVRDAQVDARVADADARIAQADASIAEAQVGLDAARAHMREARSHMQTVAAREEGVFASQLAADEQLAKAAAAIASATDDSDEYQRAVYHYTQLMRHRMANPLTSICGMTQTLLDRRDLDEATKVEMLCHILEQAKLLERVSLQPVVESDEEQNLDPRPDREGASAEPYPST